jgi:hypothetical protein
MHSGAAGTVLFRALARLSLAAALLAPALTPVPAVARDTPAAAPSPTPSPAGDLCPVEVLAVLPVPGPADETNTRYAAFLATPGSTGVASGTLWINAAGSAFHVRFVRRIAMGPPFTERADPIVFSVPAGTMVENVFVDSLDDPEPGPCSIFNTWVPGYNTSLRDEIVRAMRAALHDAEPAVAATPIVDPAGSCRSGNSPPRTLVGQSPTAADIPSVEHGVVRVKVHLAADSSIRAVSIERSEVPYYNPRALEATRKSVFVTETIRCRPIASDYLFLVVF